MDDLISRKEAIKFCYDLINAENPSDEHDHWNYSQERINQTEVILHHLEFMPSAEPERKTGRWIPCPQNASWLYVYKCSECGGYLQISDVDGKGYKANYCSYCGAKMEGGAE